MSPAYRLVTIALVLQTTMIAFEAMAVTTAMPSAAQELGSVGSYGLAFSFMMTAMLLGIVLAGIWTDRSGPLPGLYAGLVLFAAGAVLCAIAPTWLSLLAGRVVAGLGAGLVIVAEFVAIGRVYPAELRPRVFTWISAAWVVPSVVGAPVAGWITSTWSWRGVFWIVLAPAALAATLLVLRQDAIGGSGPEASADSPSSDRADHLRVARLGAVVALSAGAVQLAIHEGQTRGSFDATVGGVAALGLVALGWSVPRLLPPGTLRARRGLPAVIASRGLFNASFMSMVTFLPLMLVQVWELSLTAAGMVVAAASLGWSAGSWIQGRTEGDVNTRVRLVANGAAVLTCATIAIALATATHSPVWAFVIAVAAAGLAMGTGSTTLSVLVLDLSRPSDHGRASAALQLSDVLGSVLGIGAATAIFGALLARGGTFAYVMIEALLATIAAVAVGAGRRCRPVDDTDPLGDSRENLSVR
jgi:MFS family permease